MGVFDNPQTALLVDAILKLETAEQCRSFLEDLLTAKEITDAAQRVAVAKLLLEKANYNTVAEKTGASTATISRVNRCVVYGAGGYKSVLE
ncbi:MAG: hypothetical protein J6L00_01350 [Clostridia bacterium]|nr:hypothetical protein [Clostridia bacterium]